MNLPKIILLIVIIVFFILIYNRKKVDANVNAFIMDSITRRKIDELHPAIRDKAKALVSLAEKRGIHLRIYEALRSFERQLALYNQPIDGIDNDGDGLIDESDEKVTNAKPGDGYHNYGLAFDTVEIDSNGKALWNNPKWNEIGALGESVGLYWGGRFKSLKDLPHFEIKDFPIAHAKRNYAAEKFDKDGYILLT